LITYIQNKITGQSPQEFPLPKHNNGEFVFCGSEAELEPADPQNPYLGLFPYVESLGKVFFGREDEIALLYQKLWQPMDVIQDSNDSKKLNLLIVTGPSGTGKSSLVRAGLLPRLRDWQAFSPWAKKFKLPAPPSKRDIPDAMRPGAEPLETLDKLFATAPPEGDWIVTIDQTEELVTLGRADETNRDAQPFFEHLWEKAKTFKGTLRLILTVRTDFESQVRRLIEAAGLLPDSDKDAHWDRIRFPITPMTHEELREVILSPAAFQSVFFTEEMHNDKTLVDTLANEVLQMPGALPLLSYTLNQMFESYQRRAQDDYEITWEDYHNIGGVISSLQKRADQIFNELLPDKAHQQTMRRIMLRMVATEGGELARRRARRAELDYNRAANPLFLPTDFHYLTDIIAQLRNDQDAFAVYVWKQLSSRLQKELCSLSAAPKLQSVGLVLASEFNRLIHRNDLYEEQRCVSVNLSNKTRELLAKLPKDRNLVWFNRRLLEDAFPSLRSEESRVEWVLELLDKARLIVLGTEDG